MRRLLIIILILFSIKSSAFDISINSVRTLYQKAAENKESCKKLLLMLEPYDEKKNTLFAGYKGCATMLMAKYVFNPFSKLSNFYKGRNLLERSIVADKENVELRFLRFAVQTQVPSFLNYRNSVTQDKNFLINNYNGITDLQLKSWLTAYLKSSGKLTASEKLRLKV